MKPAIWRMYEGQQGVYNKQQTGEKKRASGHDADRSIDEGLDSEWCSLAISIPGNSMVQGARQLRLNATSAPTIRQHAGGGT